MHTIIAYNLSKFVVNTSYKIEKIDANVVPVCFTEIDTCIYHIIHVAQGMWC